MRLLTLRSVLVATDLHESSHAALRTAARLAPLAGASLHLLHVAEGSEAAAADSLLEHFREVVPGAADPQSWTVASGAPAAAIVAAAATLDADVVIVGAHRGADAAAPLGSTARRVVRTARCPCLVAGSELRLPLEHVVATVAAPGMTDGALSLALSWASALRVPGQRADLLALHVATSREPAAARDALEQEVSSCRRLAPEAAQVDITESTVFGEDPAREILRVASSSAADLLVMGTRATPDEIQALGSISAAVVRETPCPLLLIPPAMMASAGTLD